MEREYRAFKLGEDGIGIRFSYLVDGGTIWCWLWYPWAA
jgi:hypothetical protein